MLNLHDADSEKTLLTKTQHKTASYRDTFSLVPGHTKSAELMAVAGESTSQSQRGFIFLAG